jgi:hypothetical protein
MEGYTVEQTPVSDLNPSHPNFIGKAAAAKKS